MPRKLPDRRTNGWKDRQTLIHRTLWSQPGDLIKTHPYPDFPVSKKTYIYFKYSIAFPVKPFIKETKMQGEIFVY